MLPPLSSVANTKPPRPFPPSPLPTTPFSFSFTAATAAAVAVAISGNNRPPFEWRNPQQQHTQLGHFRAALLALTLTRVSAYLIQPVRAWLTALHDSVRDDRYLVGMRLQDHSDKVRQAKPPSVVPDMHRQEISTHPSIGKSRCVVSSIFLACFGKSTASTFLVRVNTFSLTCRVYPHGKN